MTAEYFSNILGMELEKAEELLLRADVNYVINETFPQGSPGREIKGSLRVIRVRFDEMLKRPELTVCKV
jgi:hypothetical protein